MQRALESVQQQTDVMRRFLERTYAERATYLREAIRDGKIAGPLADAYGMLKLNSPTDAESFLQTYASGVHIIRFTESGCGERLIDKIPIIR